MLVSAYRLVIGTKRWSSWSLRPWLLMHELDLPFEEIAIPLRSEGTRAAIAAVSPSGKIPVLIDGALTVWDSLAIIEYLADQHPERQVWPRDPVARGVARAVSAEMHSGFQALRQNCPMDFCERGLTPADPAAITADVARFVAIVCGCRKDFGAAGPFLFGSFSAADAMYAPIVSRLISYQSDWERLDGAGLVQAYLATMMAVPGMVAWGREACAEQDLSLG